MRSTLAIIIPHATHRFAISTKRDVLMPLPTNAISISMLEKNWLLPLVSLLPFPCGETFSFHLN